jgi:RNA polymerase sigma-70 factor (ECF subfamily)
MGADLGGIRELERSDAELLERIVAGDEQAFVGLYHRWRQGLFRFALAMTGCPAIADDVVQETFMIVMREASRYDPARGAVGAYLRGITRHVVHRSLRRRSRFVSLGEGEDQRPQVDGQPDPLDALHREDEARSLHAALLRLAPRLREIVVLCELQGLSYGEAAETLCVPIGTVRSRLFRAREALADELRPKAERRRICESALARLMS